VKVTAAPPGRTSENIREAPIDGLGWSSPVIADKHLWLTTATDGGSLCA
jgi:hypothetical protein